MSVGSHRHSGALVPLSADIQRRVESVQTLRKTLHDAYIVESKEAYGAASAKPPPAVVLHRTLDAPTLALLKAPNYPFLLCEGAPPAYVPPPVPYDVEGEVDVMKAKVLKVQHDIAEFQHRRARERHRDGSTASNTTNRQDAAGKLSREELADFLDGHTVFTELAWQVSSLEWFYRWVLSHSISHLWNAKEQLEFAMTENGQPLPESAEAVDRALAKCPFPKAVSILDSDRQFVIAQERRRLRSVSRTYRDHLPPIAITAATSCYLSSEEKYMYQEFFNQSEHLLLLLDHVMLMERSAAVHGSRKSSLSRGRSGSGSNLNDAEMTALVEQASSGDLVNPDEIAQEAYHALDAEHEVIQTLIETIRERRRTGVQFAISDEEYRRSREAQFAVYGCVLSDMNIMAQQMAVAKEFLTKYEEWMQHHGFDTHDALMKLLLERSGGSSWPFYSQDSWNACSSADRQEFAPPPQVWIDQLQQQRRRQQGQPSTVATHLHNDDNHHRQRYQHHEDHKSSGIGSEININNRRPPTQSRDPISRTRSESIISSTAVPATTGGGRSPAAVADILYTILQHCDTLIGGGRAPSGGTATPAPVAAGADGSAHPPLSQLWMAAALRQTVVRLARSQWTGAWLQANADAIEDALIARLQKRPRFESLVATGSALSVMLRAVAALSRRSATASRVPLTEIRVALHAPAASEDESEELHMDVAFVLSPVEFERWSAVADALWLQVDPTGAANGGLLAPATDCGSASDKTEPPSGPCFQRIEKITLPLLSRNAKDAATISLFYRVQTPMSVAASPGVTMAELIQRETPDGGKRLPSTATALAAQCARRYGYARTALAALTVVEARGFLPCYACRTAECDSVPLADVLFLSPPSATPGTAPDVVGASVGLLPPGAVQLMRLYAQANVRRPLPMGVGPSTAVMPFHIYTQPIDFTSIGLLVGRMLSDIAGCARPVLRDLYIAGETALEQAEYERQKGIVPKSFANATRYPTQMTCAPALARAVSIQRDTDGAAGAARPNRNSVCVRRFIAPILRYIDDFLETADFFQMAAEVVGPADASVTARLTEMSMGRRVGNASDASPSPSAVRPRGVP